MGGADGGVSIISMFAILNIYLISPKYHHSISGLCEFCALHNFRLFFVANRLQPVVGTERENLDDERVTPPSIVFYLIFFKKNIFFLLLTKLFFIVI